MQFSRVFPPHVSSTVFLAGRVTHRKKHWHTMLPLPKYKGKHFSLEFGLQRLIGGLHITMGKRSDRLSLGLCRGWNLYRMIFFFLPTSLFLPEPLWSFSDEKVARLREGFFFFFFLGEEEEEAVDVGDGKLMWSLRVASFHHFWNGPACTLIPADFCGAELREPKPLGQFI